MSRLINIRKIAYVVDSSSITKRECWHAILCPFTTELIERFISFLSRIIPQGCAYFSRPILSCAKARQASTRPLASHIQSSIPTCTRMSFQGSKREFSLASSPIQSNQGSTMDKTKKIGLYLLVGTLLATSLGLYANENKNTALSKQPQPVILSEVEGTAWVQNTDRSG